MIDELWEKYGDSIINGGGFGRQESFRAAMTEYGEHIKAEAVKAVMRRYMGDNNREDMEVKRCAADIERMEIK